MIPHKRRTLILLVALGTSLMISWPGLGQEPGFSRAPRSPVARDKKLVVPVSAVQVAGEMIVGYQRGRAQAVVQLCRQLGVGFVDTHSTGGFLQCGKWKPGQIAKIVKKLRAHAGVRYIDPNYRISPFLPPRGRDRAGRLRPVRRVGRVRNPNDPRFREQHGLQTIGAPRAWSAVVKSPVIVAVIDSGFDADHEDLRANVYRARAVLPNGGGVLENAFGYDFFGRETDPARKEGVYPKAFANPKDDDGHGTHVAGIIGAQGNNRVGVAGVNWSVRLIAPRVFGKKGGSVAALVDGIDYARLNGARIINASLSFKETNPDGTVKRRVDGSPIFTDGKSLRAVAEAIDRAEKAGILFVASAGNLTNDNDRNPPFPASFPNANIIAVASIQRDRALSAFSNFGARRVHIAAPGGSAGAAAAEDILSTIPGNRYAYFPGTSMAAPHVAGAAALILGHPRYRRATSADLKRLILSHSRRSPALAGKCLSGGILDLRFLGSKAQFYDPWKKDPKRRRYVTRYRYKYRRDSRSYHYHHCYSYFGQPGRYYFYSPKPFRYGWYSAQKNRVVWRKYGRGFYGLCVVTEDCLVKYQKLDKAYNVKREAIPEDKFGPPEPMPLIPDRKPDPKGEPIIMEAPLSPLSGEGG
jgi:subtilisin family serine protease